MFYNLNKSIACIYMVISVIIGAGMLALPLVSSMIGFTYSTLVLCGLWLILLYAAMLILEVTLALPLYRNNFNSMARYTLGIPGQVLVNVISFVLLYSIIGAYISGGSSLLNLILQATPLRPPASISTILFTVVLAGFIFYSTRSVDYLLRGLMSIKGILLIISIALLLPHIDFNLLKTTRNEHLLLFVLPIYTITLAYSPIIPSLVNYVGKEPKILLRSIAIGGAISLLLFIAWLAVTLGVIPFVGQRGFATIHQEHSSLPGLMQAIQYRVQAPLIYSFVTFFSNIALTASFLALGLALFDFIADTCNRRNNYAGRLQTSLIAFIPPLIFACIYPQGFIYALNFAALTACILQIIMPPLMVYQLRKHHKETVAYRAPGGNIALLLQVVLGLGILIMCVINSFHLLPIPSAFR